jgi:hypothetical protein
MSHTIFKNQASRRKNAQGRFVFIRLRPGAFVLRHARQADRQGEYAQAYQVLTEKQSAENTAQFERLAGIHFKAKRYDEAKKCYIASRGEEKAGLVAYGDYARTEGNAWEAVQAYGKAGAWDKAGALGRATAAKIISGIQPSDSEYKAAHNFITLGFSDPADANREWADILLEKALSNLSSIYGLFSQQLLASFDALNDPAASKARWKKIVLATEQKYRASSGGYGLSRLTDQARGPRPLRRTRGGSP